jgi:hypothetical protein
VKCTYFVRTIRTLSRPLNQHTQPVFITFLQHYTAPFVQKIFLKIQKFSTTYHQLGLPTGPSTSHTSLSFAQAFLSL